MKHILTLAALVFATTCFGQEACPNVHDINSNGTIDIEDFLSILGLFADVDVDEDGVWDSQDDCLDASACNYLASPTEPCAFLDAIGECGGACEGDGDGDGICDNLDTCDGELDECGICNGPGPIEVVIEDIVITYDSVFFPLDDDWYVFPVSSDTTFGYTCWPLCGDPISYQGYEYATVLIGDQCWFAENLLNQNYTNGDAIPEISTSSAWQNSTSGALTENDYDCHPYCGQYGLLYNGYAVADPRGLCPSGWHIPTDSDWSILTNYLGGESIAGIHLKSETGWNASGNGSNSSGFTGLPGGMRDWWSGNLYNAGNMGVWWSVSLTGRDLWSTEDSFGIFSGHLGWGFSVRCIRDS